MSSFSVRSIVPPNVPLPTRHTTITTQPTSYATTPEGKELLNINGWALVAAIGSVVGVGFITYYVLASRARSAKPSKTRTTFASPPSSSLTQPSPAKPVIKPSSALAPSASPSATVPASPPQAQPITPARPSVARPTPAPAVAARSAVSDKDVFDLLNLSLTSIAQGHNDESLETQIRSALLPFPSLVARPLPLRTLVAQWLLSISTLHITTAQTEDEFDRHMRQQYKDMQVAWRLLADISVSDEEMIGEDGRRGVDLIRIQIAQNLKDAQLIITVFDRMLTRRGDRSEEELIVLFTTAPLLGRWKDVRTLGGQVKEKLGSLDQFHEAPIDYSILYDLALTSDTPPTPRPTPPPSTLQWAQYQILTQRIRLRDVQCDDADAVAQLRAEFGGANTDEWKNVNLQDSARVIRCGALVQANSFSTVPMTLVGPGDGRKIECKGYADLQAECIVRQWEGYTLACETEEEMEETAAGEEDGVGRGTRLRVKAGVDRDWRGTYTMTQEKADEHGPGRFARIHVIFDLELTLRSLLL